MPSRRVRFSAPHYSLLDSLALQRFGRHDPTCRVASRTFVKAFWTPHGSCLAALRQNSPGSEVEAELVGDGAAWAAHSLEGLMTFPPQELPARETAIHAKLKELARRYRGTRVSPVPWPSDVALAYVCQQRVTFVEAARSFARLVNDYGSPAPGPLALKLAPSPERWRKLGSDRLQQAGLDLKRAETFLRVAELGPEPTLETLSQLRGVGPWTLGMCAGLAFGDPDALPLGDVHLPHTVCGFLENVPWKGDDRMVELLEPYRGLRFRIALWIMQATYQIPNNSFR